MDVTNSSSINRKKNIIDFVPLILLAIFVVLFFSSFQGLYSRWIKWDESLSHGLLINAVFVYFVYKSLPWNITTNRKTTSIFLYLILATTSIAWFVFQLSNISILEQACLLILLACLYACTYGIDTAIKYRLLFLLPIFTIPIWDQMVNPLVNLSGFAVGHMVQAINMPASIEGNSIFIPYGHIVIADGCSGLRYFEIALSIAYIISLLNNYNEKRLIPTLIIAAVLGLAANWIRIFLLVIIGYESKMQSSLMSNHEYFGWALFALMCLPAIYFAPVVKAQENQENASSPNKKPRLIIPLCLLALGPILSLFISAEPKAVKFNRVLSADNQYISADKMPVILQLPKNASSERGLINNSSSAIYVEVDQYQRINKTDKLVPYIGRLYNNEEWLATTKTVKLKTHSATLTSFRKKTSTHEVLQLQWFEVGAYKTHSLVIAKLWQIPALVSGSNDFKIVTLQSTCENETCEAAEVALLGDLSTIFADSQDF